MATPREPTPERLTQPVIRYLRATRPVFLTITLAGCLLGLATAVRVAFRSARHARASRCCWSCWPTRRSTCSTITAIT